MFVMKKCNKKTFFIKKSKSVKKKLKCQIKIRNQIVTKLKNINCDKAQQLLFLQDSWTLIETKLKKKQILKKKKKYSMYYNTREKK